MNKDTIFISKIGKFLKENDATGTMNSHET